jgi:hypothetical protein
MLVLVNVRRPDAACRGDFAAPRGAQQGRADINQ